MNDRSFLDVAQGSLKALVLQKDILILKLKIFGIHKKIDGAYKLLGEEAFLFFNEGKEAEIQKDQRIASLIAEIHKDREIIAKTEEELGILTERMQEALSRKTAPAQPEPAVAPQTEAPAPTSGEKPQPEPSYHSNHVLPVEEKPEPKKHDEPPLSPSEEEQKETQP